jgi:hypothetical protein
MQRKRSFQFVPQRLDRRLCVGYHATDSGHFQLLRAVRAQLTSGPGPPFLQVCIRLPVTPACGSGH